jgi:hypothetical protein
MLHSLLLYIFLLLLPAQLGKHFFPNFAFISGVPIDYLAPALFLTDIIAVLLICLNLKIVISFFKNKIALGFFLLIAINILFAMSGIVLSVSRKIKTT